MNFAEFAASRKSVRDFPYKEDYEGVHRQRQIDVAIQLFEVMGITREDKHKRMDWMMRGFRQFDAPVSLVLTYDKTLEPAGITQFGLGSLAYGIVLAAWDLGLGASFIAHIESCYQDIEKKNSLCRAVTKS